MVDSSSSTRMPTWLASLLSDKFFNICIIHENEKKNEKNIFCIDCCEAICSHCLTHHNSHRLLQIRRYMYNDVIRVVDAEKLMDCSSVQGYKANNAKVVFLNSRKQTKTCRNTSKSCISCDKVLLGPYLFCSISCKINKIMKKKELMSGFLHECKVLTLPEPGSDDWLSTPDSVLDPLVSPGSTASCSGIDRLTIACNATTEIVRKKRTLKFEIPAAARETDSPSALETSVNRRKSMPRRSPFN